MGCEAPEQCIRVMLNAQSAQDRLRDECLVHLDTYGNAVSTDSKAPRLELNLLPQGGVRDIQKNTVNALHKQIWEQLTQDIATRYSEIGHVRGAGLFLAVECVTARETNAPDAARAKFVVNHLRQNGVLISATGPGANVMKIRPPLVLQQAEATLFLDATEAAFAAARAEGV